MEPILSCESVSLPHRSTMRSFSFSNFLISVLCVVRRACSVVRVRCSSAVVCLWAFSEDWRDLVAAFGVSVLPELKSVSLSQILRLVSHTHFVSSSPTLQDTSSKWRCMLSANPRRQANGSSTASEAPPSLARCTYNLCRPLTLQRARCSRRGTRHT